MMAEFVASGAASNNIASGASRRAVDTREVRPAAR